VAGDFRKGGGAANFGPTGRLRPRSKDPTDLSSQESPAVAQLRSIVDAEQAHYRRTDRYGNLDELIRTGDLTPVGPHAPLRLTVGGYRLELRIASRGFYATATPLAPGSRSFTGDDSGFIVANP
jgi:hypothetical protein